MPTAVVLAGGVGSRLYPLTRVVPKPMVPFAGAPLVEYTVKSLKNAGFDEIVISARYLGEQIIKYFSGERGVKPLLLDSRDTADAVRLIAHLIKGSGDFLVLMGDVVTNVRYAEFFEYHSKFSPTASIVLKEVDNPLPYGLVYVDEDLNIVLFAEKPPSLEIYLLTTAYQNIRSPGFHSNLVNAGIYAFSEEILDLLLENTGLMDFGRHVFPYLLESGYTLKGWIAPRDTYWNDVGRVEVYKEVLWDLVEGRIRGLYPRGENISHGVYLAKEASTAGNITPPAYIGKQVSIEPSAVVGPYAVLEECVIIEPSAKVLYSAIWHRSVIGRNTYVYDSVVMNDVNIKSGVKVVSSVVGSGCTVNMDLYREIVEPCRQVSPYEGRWQTI